MFIFGKNAAKKRDTLQGIPSVLVTGNSLLTEYGN